MAFFDVKVFNLSLKRYAKQELLKAYENSKKEKYHASRTRHLDTSCDGCKCRSGTRINKLIREKRKSNYYVVTTWARYKIPFALPKLIDMCFRGCRSAFH